ncbi:Major facilitator superfamily domain general substrate transporter [Penicillium cf. griseofulvum]|uniref:Major facilitator superfamily domain general substrate transporter n=1 Tax=Penicillium cf. griseofulvum TaxID=2972120 RepID=A0A9W9MQU1_9EURO|nr:Major facilitator superfamily domain general substrate transporter [Penicillium cf. griseofulvum]KAJ5441143.1 Major facilitator superfamily domain general substrate transporter [Penicillium cf. griseofulvum]KAJ5449191.1 Major facilitator superfamily domain general substrate transporter [Penicillium cf. griseofulvum]
MVTLFRGKALSVAQALLIVAPAFIVFGYNQSGLGPLATLQSWVSVFPEIDTINTEGAQRAHNSTGKGTVIGSFQLGALFGALSCTFLGDRLGRRKTIFLGAILTIIGQLLQTAAYGLPQFIVGRVILGVGVGQLSVAVPVWQSECTSAKHRGQHVVVDGICICLGYVLCNWIDFGLSKVGGALQWRIPLAISFFFSLVVVLSVFLLPESPRWLVRVGRIEEATSSLAAYKGLPEDDDAVRAEIAGIETSLESTVDSASLMDILNFSKPDDERLLYRFCLCIALQFFQQMCGGNLISTYVSTIFEENLNMSSDLARILSSCAMTWKFICSFISFFAIDRLGRRKIFMISGTGMSVCMTVLAITNSFKDNTTASIVSAVFIFLFNSFYPIGFLGGNFLYCTEVAPMRLRVAMSAVSTANHWLWNFVVVMITPVALDTIGYKYYIVYAVISACIPISVYIFYPETMNRNLEALNHVFRDAQTPWDIVSMARHLPQGEAAEVDMWMQSEEKRAIEQKENA